MNVPNKLECFSLAIFRSLVFWPEPTQVKLLGKLWK
jgi:hypothetical protein